MSEVYNILKQNNNYTTISRNNNFNISDNSWQGYGIMDTAWAYAGSEDAIREALVERYYK